MTGPLRKDVFTQIARFAAVGGVGFMVDGGLLWFLLSADLSPYLARALSFPAAVLTTWVLNRNWTFAVPEGASRRAELRRYFTVQVVGNLTNYGIYSGILALFGTASVTVFVAFAIGSFVGSCLNFIGARVYAFR